MSEAITAAEIEELRLLFVAPVQRWQEAHRVNSYTRIPALIEEIARLTGEVERLKGIETAFNHVCGDLAEIDEALTAAGVDQGPEESFTEVCRVRLLQSRAERAEREREEAQRGLTILNESLERMAQQAEDDLAQAYERAATVAEESETWTATDDAYAAQSAASLSACKFWFWRGIGAATKAIRSLASPAQPTTVETAGGDNLEPTEDEEGRPIPPPFVVREAQRLADQHRIYGRGEEK